MGHVILTPDTEVFQNSILIQLKILYMEVSGRTSSLIQYSCMMPKIINIGWRRDTTHATEATPTTSLPPLQKVLVFSDGKQSFNPCPIAPWHNPHVHGREYRVQRSLAVETLTRWTAYKGHSSASYVQFAGRRIHSPGYDDDIVAEHDVESHYTSLAFYGYAHFY